MDFDYSEEQQQLADSLRKYLSNKYDFEARKAIINSSKGISDEAWSTFAELGLSAIPFSDADGGFGGGAVDPYSSRMSPRYFNYRKTSIYAGSNEIQHNIIAKMTLGL